MKLNGSIQNNFFSIYRAFTTSLTGIYIAEWKRVWSTQLPNASLLPFVRQRTFNLDVAFLQIQIRRLTKLFNTISGLLS